MPQPVDLNTELARSTAAQRVQEIADRASLAAQHRQSQQAQQEQVQAETQVQEPPQSEHGPTVTERRQKDQQRERGKAARGHGDATGDTADHGAGELQVVPDENEQHRLDITV